MWDGCVTSMMDNHGQYCIERPTVNVCIDVARRDIRLSDPWLAGLHNALRGHFLRVYIVITFLQDDSKLLARRLRRYMVQRLWSGRIAKQGQRQQHRGRGGNIVRIARAVSAFAHRKFINTDHGMPQLRLGRADRFPNPHSLQDRPRQPLEATCQSDCSATIDCRKLR